MSRPRIRKPNGTEPPIVVKNGNSDEVDWGKYRLTPTHVHIRGDNYSHERIKSMSNWELFLCFGIHRGHVGDYRGAELFSVGETKAVGIILPTSEKWRQIWGYAELRKHCPDIANEVEARNEDQLGKPLQGAPKWMLDIINDKKGVSLKPKIGKPVKQVMALEYERPRIRR
jgi:hypothetical protein